MTRRRSVISKVGVGLTSLSVLGSVSGKNNPNSESYALEEVDKLTLNAYNDAGKDGVKRVLENHDYNYTLSSKKLAETDDYSGGNNSHISVQNKYSKSGSEVLCSAFGHPESDERIRVQTIAKLDDISATPGMASWAQDAIGITFNEDHWTVVGDSSRRIQPEGAGNVNLFSNSLEGGGFAATVDMPNKMFTSANVLLAVSLRNVDGVPGTVVGSYEHNWSVNPTNVEVKEITGGKGPIEVTLSGSSSNWDLAEDTDTDGIFST